jgi:hypothetical protein
MSTRIPAEDHVVRYVRKRQLRTDSDGNVIGVLPDAFNRREHEEYLSSTWLEHFSREYERGLSAAAAAISRQLEVKRRDGFTLGNVGKVIEICESFDVRVRLLNEENLRTRDMPPSAVYRANTWSCSRCLPPTCSLTRALLRPSLRQLERGAASRPPFGS